VTPLRKDLSVELASPIKAFQQRAERYHGLQLEYERSVALKAQILQVFERVKADTGLEPEIYEDITMSDQELFYIEFYDEFEHEGSRFFTQLEHDLGIGRSLDEGVY
jgi:hypothetical protein